MMLSSSSTSSLSSSVAYVTALRHEGGGVCTGTVWKSCALRGSVASKQVAAAAADQRNAVAVYAVLVAHALHAYDNEAAFRRGDAPLHTYFVVGASAWSPVTKKVSSTSLRGLFGGATSSKDATVSSSSSSNTTTTSSTTSFRLVTSQGTQVYCWTATQLDRDTWLTALHAGLELALAHSHLQPQMQNTTSTKSTTTTEKEATVTTAATVAATATAVGQGKDADSTSNTESPPRKTFFGIDRSQSASNATAATSNGTTNSTATSPTPLSTSSSWSMGSTSTASATPANWNMCPICQRITESSLSSLSMSTFNTTIASTATTSTTVPMSSTNYGWPVPQCALEDRCDLLCVSCGIAQGVYHYVHVVQCLYAAISTERSILSNARASCRAALQQAAATKSKSATKETDPSAPDSIVSSNNEATEDATIATTNTNTNVAIDETVVVEWLQTTECVSWARRCSSFDKWRRDVLRSHNSLLGALSESMVHFNDADNDHHHVHLVSGTDFIEWLDEAAGGQRRPETMAAAALKQQAVRVAGDMGTAMQLLLEQAVVPIVGLGGNYGNHNMTASSPTSLTMPSIKANGISSLSNNNNNLTSNTEVLQCVLEFFLDLCDEGELSSVAFYWPQLCHIHLRMLPATNAQSLARIELVEDFLLTVATRYSIHLCLDLVWSHTADLEESLQVVSSSSAVAAAAMASNSERSSSKKTSKDHHHPVLVDAAAASAVSPSCRRRRFAVLRFLCELESLLFDFDGGWGGGSVSLGRMLSPSAHQVELLKQAAQHIQQLRLETNHYHNPDAQTTTENTVSDATTLAPHNFLTRSARFDLLSKTREALAPEEQANEKMRIAGNADYFTSHVNFSKRLADIAEKLRFMDVADRAAALQDELTLLNCSGTMGGDPLNRIREHLIRVVRVPITEGHVFRSKERTPVLLLLEVFDEMVSEVPPASLPPPPPPPPLEPPLASVQNEESKNDEASEVAQDKSSDQANQLDEVPTETVELDASNAAVNPQSADVEQPLPPAPSSPGPTRTQPDMLEGALEGSRQSPGPKALKRFDKEGDAGDSSFAPTTPKSDVQLLVSSFAEEQLKEIEMPDFTRLESVDTVEEQDASNDESLATAPTTADSAGKSVSFRPSPQRDDAVRSSRKMSTLVNPKYSGNDASDASSVLARTGDIRRAVLTTIMMRGLQGSHTIAAGAADSAQRSLKELERKRATELLLSGDDDESPSDSNSATDVESTKQKVASLGLSPSLEEAELASRPTEEDEVMEAIRLILIQNQVAQGKLSQADAAKVLQHTSLSPINAKKATASFDGNGSVDLSDHPTIDAGDVDPRLVGCGPLPPAALQAMTLWKGGMVTHAELLELVKKDIEFVKHSVLVDAENLDMLKENSAFWGRFAFGERWAEKKSRIGSSSPQGSIPGWDMMGVIVKSNDDLRQEAFVMQLIELCQEAFELAELELWVSPYRIVATGRSTGVIECVRNAMSFDALKKRPGYGKGGLREHLQRMTEFTADPGGAFLTAQQNFVRSLAAYSLMSYFFLFKDRHNGNLLLDTAGHVIHIDFGFVFGIAPGGSFSLEMSTPFKLTEEMLDVMGGLRSPLFAEFVTLFCCGFLALQLHCDTFLTLVEITSKDSTFKCFDGRDTQEVVSKLRERFCPDLSKEDTISFALDLIKQATTSYGTRQYDLYQYLSQGIVA